MVLVQENNQARDSWERVVEVQKWGSAPRLGLGPITSYSYRTDPKCLSFVLARYKFCAKMLSGKRHVLEIGCGDAFGTPLVAQAVEQVTATDWDPRLIEDNTERMAFLSNCTFKVHDITTGEIFLPTAVPFDGIYSLDVIEHLDPENADLFMLNSCNTLSENGICIVGTPNVTAAAYASPVSQTGHINVMSANGLESLMSRYLKTVLMFSMNDEVVHTGFQGMAHYLFAVGIGPK